MLTGLIGLIIGLALVGLLLWVIEQIPMDATIAKVIRVVIVVVAALWMIAFIASAFGIAMPFGAVPGRLR